MEDSKCIPINDCNHPQKKLDLKAFTCVECLPNCLFCHEQSKQCSTCKSGYFLDNFDCYKCGNNCSFCRDSIRCDRCLFGYELQKGECIKIQKYNEENQMTNQKENKFIQQVDEQEIKDKSIELFDNDQISVEKKLSNFPCILGFKNQIDKCYNCDNKYYLGSDFKCYSCSENCVRCRSDRICLKCEGGFNLNFLKIKNEIQCISNKVKY